MGAKDIDLLLKYPLISCHEHNGFKYYRGKIMCGVKDIDLQIVETSTGPSDYKLETQLTPEINKKVAELKPTSIVDFLDKIATTVGSSWKIPKNLATAYRRVLHEYSEFTRFHLNIRNSHISTDLSKIVATTVDEVGREHQLDICVDFNETKDVFKPAPFPFPEQSFKDLPPRFSNLTSIYNKFIGVVESLQPFFNTMDALDDISCIIDPEKPTRRDCHRRIWLGSNFSVLVVVDPLNSAARPDLKFLGPEHIIEPFIQKYSQSLEDWEQVDLIHRILDILGLNTFPIKPNQAQNILLDVGECSICFSLRFNDKMPEVVCENQSCELVYHVDCLYEWLSSLNSKRIFNQIHGQCPNCEKRISCPMPVS